MLDIARAQINWRGHPVALLSDGVCTLLFTSTGRASHTAEDLGEFLLPALAEARDVAEADEPSGWQFETQLSGETVWVELYGGMRETDRHEGGRWSVYLPRER